MYCNTVILEAIENFILASKRYVLNLCTAILYSWRLMKYCGGHNLPTNNVNTVTLFLMYRVIRISCLLRAILASSVAQYCLNLYLYYYIPLRFFQKVNLDCKQLIWIKISIRFKAYRWTDKGNKIVNLALQHCIDIATVYLPAFATVQLWYIP